MTIQKIKAGDVFTSKLGDKCTVIEYNGWDKILIEFNDEHKHRTLARSEHLRNGAFKNPYRPTYYGIGYIGHGKYRTRTVCHKAWEGMLARCYKEFRSIKNESYKDCKVCPDWHNFQNFAKWYNENEFCEMGYQLDKDLLSTGERIYSAETCCLLPPEINAIFIGGNADCGKYPKGVCYRKEAKSLIASVSINNKSVLLGRFDCPEQAHQAYVVAKEKHVKAMAKKYRGKIEERVYSALIAWTVNK